MKRLALVLLALATALAITPAALADNFVYSFTTNDANTFGFGALSGTIVLSGTEVGPGNYLISSGTIDITSVSGSGFPTGTGSLNPVTVNGGDASGYFPGAFLSPSGFFYFDDILYSTSKPQLDIAGLLFIVDGLEINIFANGNPALGGSAYTIYDNGGALDTGTFNAAPVVPEPSSLLLLGTGLLGLALLVFRKAKPASRLILNM